MDLPTPRSLSRMLAAALVCAGCAAEFPDQTTASLRDAPGGKADTATGTIGDLTLILHNIEVAAAPVSVWFHHGFGSPSSTQTAAIDETGSVTLRWEDEWHYHSFGALVNVWIDTDRDGTCSAWDVTYQDFISPFRRELEGVEITLDLADESLPKPNQLWCNEFERTGTPATEAADCRALCAHRGGCFRADACEAFCNEEVSFTTLEVYKAFDLCVIDNPLCYQDARSCTEAVADRLEFCAKVDLDLPSCLQEGGLETAACVQRCLNAGGERTSCLAGCYEI